MRQIVLALVVLTSTSPVMVRAQSRWKAIGTTNVGNTVELDTRSVRRAKGLTEATLRVQFAKPVKTPQGPITSARTALSVDCAKHQVAIRENTYYLDEKTNKIYQHVKAGIPGYTPPMGGSMPEVAVAYLCKTR